ncbi:MAG: restriction endonuclease [Myxococcota bacterium]|nr:restriction endonuclease [Myxococcota bacterium]
MMNEISEAVLTVLEESSRPLNQKRLLRAVLLLELDGDVDEDAILMALDRHCADGLVKQSRPGVYRLVRQSGGGVARRTDGRRTRRKRSRMAAAGEGFPTAPLTLDETAAMSAQAAGREQLRDALWKRMTRRAAEVVGQSVMTTQDIDIDDLGLDQDEMSELDAGIEAARKLIRMQVWDQKKTDGLDSMHVEVETDSPSEQIEDADLFSAVRYAELDIPRSDAQPYRERRSGLGQDHEGPNHREPRLREFAFEGLTASSVRHALLQNGACMDLDALGKSLDGPLTSTEKALREGIEAHNQARANAGLRPLFYWDERQCVGLTEWSCPDDYLVIEQELLDVVAKLRERVRRSLIERVSELAAEQFEILVQMVLSRMGFTHFRTVHQTEGGQLMLTAKPEHDTGAESITVIAQRDWTPIGASTIKALRDSLEFFNSTRGMVLTVGTYTREAIDVALEPNFTPIQLLDGEVWAKFLYKQRLGVDVLNLDVCYPSSQLYPGASQ